MNDESNLFIDLEPTPEDDANNSSAASSNGQVQQRQIQDRLSDIALLKDILPDLRFNTLTQKIEYGSRTKPTVMGGDDLDLLPTKLACQHNVFIPEARIRNSVRYAAKENAYCPIKRYLLECSYSANPYPEWNRLGEVLLGNDMPLATTALQRFFIGAVARAFEPSCNMSWLPIFIGKQGCGKSQLIRELVPPDLFAELTVGLDILMKEPFRLHVAWVIELPEIDQFFQIRNIENFKNLITTRSDETRLPYQPQPVSLPRRFVMAGTSNRSEFLVDPSGNRRFIPLEIPQGFETPWRQMRTFRDQIWKSAMAAYQEGQSWEVTTGELAQMSEYIQSFSVVDPWESLVIQYVGNLSETSVTDVLIHGLKFMPQNTSTKESKRVASILTAHGWRRFCTSRNGKSVRLWKRPEDTPLTEKSLDDF